MAFGEFARTSLSEYAFPSLLPDRGCPFGGWLQNIWGSDTYPDTDTVDEYRSTLLVYCQKYAHGLESHSDSLDECTIRLKNLVETGCGRREYEEELLQLRGREATVVLHIMQLVR
jgi:hypothetical protein